VVILITSIKKRSDEPVFAELIETYKKRIIKYARVDTPVFSSENAFFQSMDRQRSRTAPHLVLLDSRGKQFTSDQFAAWLGQQRDQGLQTVVFAIGPADGWSDESRQRADLLLSLGPMTLPHELARVALCEQVYRAFTILSGHPYHTGH
jgi:23S rRNA (pseudouridine1915-N3)-methyltransferase